jgi:hypothetical protein
MEQILIVGDDSEVNEDNEMQHEEQHNHVNKDNNIDISEVNNVIDYLCKLYVVDRKGIEGVIGKINNSITARYVITAVTTLRSSSSIEEMMNAANEKEMSDILSSSIINMYSDNDKLKSQIDKASETVSRIKDTNNDMRQLFETEIKAAFDREKEATTALIEQYKISLEAKDKTYTLIMRNNNDIKKENKELKEQNNELKIKNDELKAMLALQTKNKVNKSEQVSDEKVNNNQLCKRLFHFWGKKDDKKVSVVLDTFISDILSNKDFSKAQKEFLMSCIESDMSYEEVKRIAKPELDVDMMDRLMRYYKSK